MQSMMKNLSTVAVKHNQRYEEAHARYLELMHLDESEPGVAKELEAILPLIGKKPGDAIADYNHIQEAKKMEGWIVGGRVSNDEIEAAQKAIREHMAETKRIEDERAKELARLRGINGALQGRIVSAHQRVHDLRQHRQARIDLYLNRPMATMA